MLEELLNLCAEESRRNRCLAAIATEQVLRTDYLHKADLFDKAAALFREYSASQILPEQEVKNHAI